MYININNLIYIDITKKNAVLQLASLPTNFGVEIVPIPFFGGMDHCGKSDKKSGW